MNDELSDLNPLDPEEHARQLAGVLELATVPSRIVDLGAGSGRMAVPLANAGASVLAVDLDPAVFESDDWSLGEGVTPLVEDILASEATWHQQGLFQTALCVGNTLALFTRHQELALLFRRITASLEPGGCFLVDDFPLWGWEAVQAGDWPSGLSEDGSAQIVWRPGEPIFAFRTGSAVDQGSRQLEPSDRPLRLWSISELDFLADATGLTAPTVHADHHLIEFRRP